MKLQQVLIQGYRENLDFDVGIVASISNLVVVPSSDFVNSVLNLTGAIVLDIRMNETKGRPFL
jgi:hypothetical protein